jgi:hypothetical protein
MKFLMGDSGDAIDLLDARVCNLHLDVGVACVAAASGLGEVCLYIDQRR